MKIYVDGYFSALANTSFTTFNDISEIPNDCDIIGISFYNNLYLDYLKIIEQLLPKTKKLLVNISEPTPGYISVVDFITRSQHSKIHLFSDIVINQSPILPQFSTMISWFITPDNVYVTRPWAQPLMSQLTNWQEKHAVKKFDCLLGTKREHRDIIHKFYQRSDIQDQIIYNYFQSINKTGIWPTDLESIDENLNARYHGHHVNISWLIPVEIYNQTWYSVVAETTTQSAYSQFTEKVAKPIVSQRPFVAFCGQHYLRNLRSLGFKTFESVIDQSYDEIEDIDARFAKAWQQVEWLCDQNPVSVYQELESVLLHNKQHFLNTDWQAPAKRYF